MSMNDSLAAALSKINNVEKIGKRECVIKPTSKVIEKVLDILKDELYIGGYEKVKDGKGSFLVLQLIGSLNKCSVIKPRSAIALDTYEKFEKRFLPAKDFGLLIISTPQGIMTHHQSKQKKLGGKLLAYCY